MSARRVLLSAVGRMTPSTSLYRLRRELLRAQGFKVAPSARVTASASFLIGNVKIGEETFIGHRLHAYGGTTSSVVIGKRCAIGPDVSIFAGTHEVSNSHSRAGLGVSTTVFIEDGCWVGGRAVLVGPCRIGTGSIIAAGAIVRFDVPTNSLYFGPRANDLRPIEP